MAEDEDGGDQNEMSDEERAAAAAWGEVALLGSEAPNLMRLSAEEHRRLDAMLLGRVHSIVALEHTALVAPVVPLPRKVLSVVDGGHDHLLGDPAARGDRDELQHHADVAIDAVRELHNIRECESGRERAATDVALVRVIREAVRPCLGLPIASDRGPRLVERFERRLECLRDAVRRRLDATPARSATYAPAARHWMWTAPMLTMVAALLLASGQLRWAAALLAVRMVVSTRFDTPGFVADGDGPSSPWTVNVVGCVAGHAVDALAFMGVSVHLAMQHRPVWAFLVVFSSVAMLLSTLLRVAVLQEGYWLPRLYTERVARNGCLLAWISVATVVQPSVPLGGIPLLALSATGALAFSVIEVRRALTTRHLFEEPDNESVGAESEFVRVVAAVVVPLEQRLSMEREGTGTEGRPHPRRTP